MRMRIFTALLALLLTYSLVACSENESESEESLETTPEVTSETSQEEEEESEPDVLCAESLEDFEYTTDDSGRITLTAVKQKKIVSCKIPAGVTAIASSTFRSCNLLESIEFSSELTSIALGTFSDCIKLIETVNGVSYVGTWAVDCMEEVTAVSLREGTVGIADSVFAGCARLESVTIPASVAHIGTYAFSRCEALSSLVLPEKLLTIGGYAFFSCTSLESVAFPGSVTSICEYTLGECTALKSVTIPASVVEIGEGGFYGCSLLTTVSYGGDAAGWDAITVEIGNEALMTAYENQ